ncbi:TPA: fimbrial protein [Enterobacter asburiae]|nr:fimbrial protein [Enterobacter asburiae]HCM9424992.1 fimbrial protein [Enterobacter asburiae]HCM9499152.1 fimbrial protein [Enterobacter asburiae]HCM9500516.1 fimbrial protein [Enterobacter asburiae]HCM9580255.1 fimbrial protein [Enterobacter asburiae]
MAGILTINVAKSEDNVHFSGALVAEPCTLPEADTDIHVDFGTVIVKYLYQYQRTKSQPFTIHLQDCDPSVMKTVSVTLEGTEDDELTDLLALDSSSSAKGVAIGFEQENGEKLKINTPTPYKQLSKGNNAFILGAYLSTKPTFTASKKIELGGFSSISTFKLNYE